MIGGGSPMLFDECWSKSNKSYTNFTDNLCEMVTDVRLARREQEKSSHYMELWDDTQKETKQHRHIKQSPTYFIQVYRLFCNSVQR